MSNVLHQVSQRTKHSYYNNARCITKTKYYSCQVIPVAELGAAGSTQLLLSGVKAVKR